MGFLMYRNSADLVENSLMNTETKRPGLQRGILEISSWMIRNDVNVFTVLHK